MAKIPWQSSAAEAVGTDCAGNAWGCRGKHGAGRPWGEEQQHHLLCPRRPLLRFIFFLFVTQSQIMGSQLSGCWGEGVNSRGPAPGKGSKREQKPGKICPPHVERGCLEHRSALPLHSIPSLPLEKVTETFVEKVLVEQATLLGGGRDCRVSGSDRQCPSLLQRMLIPILCFKGPSVREVLRGGCLAGVRVQLLLWKAAAEQPRAL